MIISYDAVVVCGFEYNIRGVKVEKTKYDLNTGEPITVMVPSHEEILVGDVVVADSKEDQYMFCAGLEFRSSEGQGWLGKVVAHVDNYNDLVEISFELPKEVSEFASKHGLIPKWFLSMSCG